MAGTPNPTLFGCDILEYMIFPLVLYGRLSDRYFYEQDQNSDDVYCTANAWGMPGHTIKYLWADTKWTTGWAKSQRKLAIAWRSCVVNCVLGCEWGQWQEKCLCFQPMMPGMDSMEHGMAMVWYGMVWYVLHGIEQLEQMLLSHTQSYTAHRFNKHAK